MYNESEDFPDIKQLLRKPDDNDLDTDGVDDQEEQEEARVREGELRLQAILDIAKLSVSALMLIALIGFDAVT
jgi:hypothetical protein